MPVVLETNTDDCSGEVLAHALEKLLEEGASDAYIISVIGKKGRPGALLRVMCEKREARKFAKIMMEETGSRGVREFSCKHRKGAGGKKIEYRKAKEVAKKFGIPLRAVYKVLGGRI